MKNLLLVFIGGGIGSVLRYLLSLLNPSISPSFPWTTFIVNITGSLLIGLFAGLLIDDTEMQHNWKLLLITGFCGGFTTFSAFSKESFHMIQQQQFAMLFAYVLLSVILCISAVAAGFFICR